MIHGSSEERFKITYCSGKMTKDQVEAVNFRYADLSEMMKLYNPDKLTDGFNTVNGEEIYFICNSGMGLWSFKDRFDSY